MSQTRPEPETRTAGWDRVGRGPHRGHRRRRPVAHRARLRRLRARRGRCADGPVARRRARSPRSPRTTTSASAPHPAAGRGRHRRHRALGHRLGRGPPGGRVAAGAPRARGRRWPSGARHRGRPRAAHRLRRQPGRAVPPSATAGVRILSDELNHASIIDGCRLARAEVAVYRHADPDHLAGRARPRPGADGVDRTIVVTDTVFSMDGDVAPRRPPSPSCCRAHGSLLIVDEAHAVLGPDARPAASSTASRSLRVGTLSKTLGSLGGFVAGSRRHVDLLVNLARPFIFTTAPTPADTAAALAAARHRALGAEGDELRARLRRPRRPAARPVTRRPILPVVVGDEARRRGPGHRAARAEGILVPAIRPPTVPPGTSRLRIALSAAHTDAQIEQLAAALARPGYAPSTALDPAAERPLMPERPRRLVVVVGTGTEIGKTWVAAAALARAAGRRRTGGRPQAGPVVRAGRHHAPTPTCWRRPPARTRHDGLPAAPLVRGGAGPAHGRRRCSVGPPFTLADLRRRDHLARGRRGRAGRDGRRGALAPGRRRRRRRGPDRRRSCPTWWCWWPTPASAPSTPCASPWPPSTRCSRPATTSTCVVVLNRFDPADDLHRRNLAWLARPRRHRRRHLGRRPGGPARLSGVRALGLLLGDPGDEAVDVALVGPVGGRRRSRRWPRRRSRRRRSRRPAAGPGPRCRAGGLPRSRGCRSSGSSTPSSAGMSGVDRIGLAGSWGSSWDGSAARGRGSGLSPSWHLVAIHGYPGRPIGPTARNPNWGSTEPAGRAERLADDSRMLPLRGRHGCDEIGGYAGVRRASPPDGDEPRPGAPRSRPDAARCRPERGASTRERHVDGSRLVASLRRQVVPPAGCRPGPRAGLVAGRRRQVVPAPRDRGSRPTPGWWLAADGKWYPPTDRRRPGPEPVRREPEPEPVAATPAAEPAPDTRAAAPAPRRARVEPADRPPGTDRTDPRARPRRRVRADPPAGNQASRDDAVTQFPARFLAAARAVQLLEAELALSGAEPAEPAAEEARAQGSGPGRGHGGRGQGQAPAKPVRPSRSRRAGLDPARRPVEPTPAPAAGPTAGPAARAAARRRPPCRWVVPPPAPARTRAGRRRARSNPPTPRPPRGGRPGGPLIELRPSPLGADLDHLGDRLLVFEDRVELRDRADHVRQVVVAADIAEVGGAAQVHRSGADHRSGSTPSPSS